MLKTVTTLCTTILSAAVLSGCVTTSIVKKPEVDVVKTIAVVSVYSNTGIKNTRGESETSKVAGMANMFGMTGNNSKAGDSAAGKLLDFGGTRLVEHAKQEIERELTRVKGWKVVDSAQFIDKEAYQKFATDMDDEIRKQEGVMRKISGPSVVTVPRMAAFPYGMKEKNEVLKKLAKDLDVDAVAILKLDMAYSPSTSIGGHGTASAAISSNLEIVNKNGETAVLGSLREVNSADTVGMMGGSIMFSPKTETIFKQAISKTAEIYSDKINKEM